MALAPELDAADLVISAEEIAVAVLAQPPSLTGCLTGLPTGGFGTIPLALFGPWIGIKNLVATAAFASGLRTAQH